MIDHWPSGGRDTTEFPQVKIDVDSTFRNHLAAFCGLDGIGWNDYETQKTVTGLNVEPSRLRTYRKLYQNLGVIFKDGDLIKVSNLGSKLNLLQKNLIYSRDHNLSEIAKIAVDILSRYQINNPTESQRNELPENCDVLPCICIWKAMLSLDNKLHYEEVNRVMLRIMSMDQLDKAIHKISEARINHFPYQGKDSALLDDCLGQPVHLEQESARIAPWFSFAGWGGLLIDRDVDSDGFRNLVPNQIPLLKIAVSNPPTFYKAENDEEWYEYYIGSAAVRIDDKEVDGFNGEFYEISKAFLKTTSESNLIFSSELLTRLIASSLSKRFVVLTGLAGSGKTKIAQAFSRWITPDPGWIDDADRSKGKNPNSYYALVPVGADWTGNENIIGYPNGLDTNTYVTKPALELVRHALKPAHAATPHFLILDEMNLSHVERYFADILSAIESGEEIPLYEGDVRKVDEVDVPRRLRLPENLFIIGTVNVDETTYMFSPKVLDRANVIEFRLEPDSLQSFLSSPKAPRLEELDGKGAAFGGGFVEAAADKGREVPAAVKESYEREMLLFFNLLREHNAEFGYRTSYEAARFIHFYNHLGGYPDGSVDWFDSAMDAVVVQKFLPKLHGSRSKLEGLLWALAWACGAERIERGGKSFTVQIREASQAQDDALYGPETLWETLAKSNPDDPAAAARYPLSFDKVMRMWRKLVRDQFVTFAEA